MAAVPCSLLRVVQTHDAGQAAITDINQDKRWTFGDLVAFAARCRGALGRLGLEPGDTVVCDLDPGGDLAALLLACWKSGLQLRIESPDTSGRASRAAATTAKLFVSRAPKSPSTRNVRQFSMAELDEFATARSSRNPIDDPAAATITAGSHGATETMRASALLQSAANFNAVCPTSPGENFLSTSALGTLEELCISTVIPLALGLHVILAGEDPAPFGATAEGATLCELSAPALRRLLAHGTAPHLPAQIRAVFCSSSRLIPEDVAHAEAALNRPLHRGYGTLQTGFWATVASGGRISSSSRLTCSAW